MFSRSNATAQSAPIGILPVITLSTGKTHHPFVLARPPLPNQSLKQTHMILSREQGGVQVVDVQTLHCCGRHSFNHISLVEPGFYHGVNTYRFLYRDTQNSFARSSQPSDDLADHSNVTSFVGGNAQMSVTKPVVAVCMSTSRCSNFARCFSTSS